MKISIVVPTYNGAEFLSATLASIVAQTFPGWECVVVDDGSTDDSLAVARQWADRDPRIRAISTANGGVAAARNVGCERIDPSSAYVAFLDQDDVWAKDTLERLMGILEASPAAVAAHGMARLVDSSGRPSGAVLNDERRKVVGDAIAVCMRDEPTTFQTLLCDCCLPTPGVALIRRSALAAIRQPDGTYFDSTLLSANDWHLWLRLSLLGDLAFIDDVVLDWRCHSANESHDDLRMARAEALVRQKIARRPDLTAAQRRAAQWRCRRSFASAERRTAALCAERAAESIRRARFAAAGRFAGAWMAHYAAYLALRLSPWPSLEIPVPPPV